MNFASQQFRVGALVLAIGALVAYMSLRVSRNPDAFGTAKHVWFLIPDASGLVPNAAVQMAGINVGFIRDIRLEGGLARVDMSLKRHIPLYESARVQIRANGILGDKHIELISGNPADPRLPDGAQIISVEDHGSMDALIDQVARITHSLGEVADSLKSATTGKGDTSQPLGRIVHNVEVLTGDLAGLAQAKKKKLAQIIDNVDSLTNTLNKYVNDKSDKGLQAAIEHATESLSHIDGTLRNINEIAAKINDGKGTIGKLVNDPKTVDEINHAVERVNDYLDTADRLQTSVDFHTYYEATPGASKSFVSVRLQPGPDRYYEIGAVDDPRGVVETTQIQDQGTGVNSNVTQTKTYYYRVKFDAEFAKIFGNLTVRGGLIESTGGAGLDYSMFHRNLKFSLEAFRFNQLDLRATARYNLYKGIYLMGGADDLLNKVATSAFIGGGIDLTNDDLKMFLSKAPF